MRNLLILSLFILFISCKNDTKTGSENDASGQFLKTDNSEATDPAKLTIPSACEMMNEATLQSILKISGSAVNIKEANDPSSNSAKSCFFRWEDADTPNAGILIQIQTNPVFDEYPQYISGFVAAKLTNGETALGADKPSIFKKFTAGETVGAYSYEQSRFYWNLGNNYLFMLAFNISTLGEDKMVDIGKQIVSEVNKNFATKVNQ